MTAAGDNLDRALHQERSELVLALNGNPVNADMAWQILHRWDALVEIARAAQRYVECFDIAGVEREISDDAWTALRAALACLNTKEGT